MIDVKNGKQPEYLACVGGKMLLANGVFALFYFVVGSILRVMRMDAQPTEYLWKILITSSETCAILILKRYFEDSGLKKGYRLLRSSALLLCGFIFSEVVLAFLESKYHVRNYVGFLYSKLFFTAAAAVFKGIAGFFELLGLACLAKKRFLAVGFRILAVLPFLLAIVSGVRQVSGLISSFGAFEYGFHVLEIFLDVVVAVIYFVFLFITVKDHESESLSGTKTSTFAVRTVIVSMLLLAGFTSATTLTAFHSIKHLSSVAKAYPVRYMGFDYGRRTEQGSGIIADRDTGYPVYSTYDEIAEGSGYFITEVDVDKIQKTGGRYFLPRYVGIGENYIYHIAVDGSGLWDRYGIHFRVYIATLADGHKIWFAMPEFEYDIIMSRAENGKVLLPTGYFSTDFTAEWAYSKISWDNGEPEGFKKDEYINCVLSFGLFVDDMVEKSEETYENMTRHCLVIAIIAWIFLINGVYVKATPDNLWTNDTL